MERNQTLKEGTLIQSIEDSILQTIHILSLDHSMTFGSRIFGTLVLRRRRKAAIFLEEGKASRSHK